MSNEAPSPGLPTGYARFQLARALRVAVADDEELRHRAAARSGEWAGVLSGMLSGFLSIGSRQPVAGLPIWVTPEVVTGGFATGAPMAGGVLRPHERELLDTLGGSAAGEERMALNTWFLSDAGFAQLQERLQNGCYAIDVPEEAALLCAAWLAKVGEADAARTLVGELAPFFDRLRFYPRSTPSAFVSGASVFLESVAEVRRRLQRIGANARIMAQADAIRGRIPLRDRLIELFLETVAGEPPSIRVDADGRWADPTTRRFHVEGGWPCRQYPAGWSDRARALLAQCQTPALSAHRVMGELIGLLRRCAADPAALTGREVGRIRLHLARHLSRWGGSDSDRRRRVRAGQASQAAAPLHRDLAVVVDRRLAACTQELGVEAIDPILQPVHMDEAGTEVASGTELPKTIRRKVERCFSATPAELVGRGVVKSGETLARIVPQFTSGLRAAALSDPAAGRLYAATYRAFRGRRSLLLLNYESQVKLEELPWMAALWKHRGETGREVPELAHRALRELASLALRSFPAVVVPNKLLQELRALAEGAGLELPLVDELAADIFMGGFSPKFLAAARLAAELLEGSLYARYYDIDYPALHGLTAPQKRRWPESLQPSEDAFADLCRARAGISSTAWNVAANGMIIEQAQILTTQNLAPLVQELELAPDLRPDALALAGTCFRWVIRRLQVKCPWHHGQLIQLKNGAYAWRQMIFFASLLAEQERATFLSGIQTHFQNQPDVFRLRFGPAFRGLERALRGETSESVESRRFLGWSVDRHWLLGPKPATRECG